MRRISVFLIVLACLSPAAAVASPRAIVRDCTDNGRIDGRYSQADYAAALANLESDIEEYTECRRIIQEAKRRDARSGGSPGGGPTPGAGGPVTGFNGGSPPPPVANVPANPGEQGLIDQAAGPAGQAPVAVAGEPITPGGSGIVEAAVRHSLPAPLLVLVILLGLGALATTLSGARSRGIHAPDPVLRLFERVFPRRA